MDLISENHLKGFSIHHLNWAPKYRFRMFKKEKHRVVCEAILHDIAKEHKIEIIELAVSTEHVHAIVQIPANMSVSKAAQFPL